MAANLGRQPTKSVLSQMVGLAAQVQNARHLHAVGRLDEARVAYEAILKLQPNNSDVLHMLAVLKQQLGQTNEAVRLVRQLLKVDRSHVDNYVTLADFLRQAGDTTGAIASYKKAIKFNPRLVGAYVGYGITLGERGRHSEALLQLDKALALDGRNADALNNRGNCLRALGRFTEALESYERALQVAPGSGGVLYNLGVVLCDLGRFAEAVVSYDAALAIHPFETMAYNNRGNALSALNRLSDALDSYNQALAIEPRNVLVLSNRGIALRDLGRLDEALLAFDQALALDPRLVTALNNKGDLLKDLGRFDAARTAFEAALALDPTCGAYYSNLALVKTFAADDQLIRQMETLLADPKSLRADDGAKIEYALAKAYADCRDHDRAFQHYMSGARTKRSFTNYDEAATMRLFDEIEAIFTADFLSARSGLGNPSDRPIFIVGMPRSGTTLVEQVLASHASVHGAGELSEFNRAVNSAECAWGASFPHVANRLDDGGFAAIGAEYLERIRRISPDLARVTDKMPSNFFFLGLIHLALPNARIIHTLRDPIDTCLSCFTIHFTDPQDFSYDLAELGRYYRRYRRLMAHWRRVLPEGTILDIRYEDVVADLEAEARRIVGHCDLPWDGACLSFYQSKRAVRTASAAQVRQPIYKASVGRWHAYEPYLGPLIDALGPEVVSDMR